jgi:hypothetical protein
MKVLAKALAMGPETLHRITWKMERYSERRFALYRLAADAALDALHDA